MDNMDICRGCMTATNFLLDIFSDQHKQHYDFSMAEMINEIVSFKVQRGDKLPQKVCMSCGTKAQIGFRFKRDFEQCHQLLCMKLNTYEDDAEDEDISDTLNLDVQTKASFKTKKCIVRLKNIKLPTAAKTNSQAKLSTTNNPEPQIVKSLSKHSKVRNFRCDLCGVCYSTKRNLENHQMIHDEKRKYKCLHCLKTYRKKNKLERHISKHIKHVSNMCRLCAKSFSCKTELKQHFVIHSDERPFICPHCKMSFKLKTTLRRHLNLHSGVRPHKCDSCDKSFITKWNLVRHSKSCNAKK